MAFQITTSEDQKTFEEYQAAHNKVRDLIAYGVYPHVLQAIAAYDDLDDLVTTLAAGTANEQELADYDDGLRASISTDEADLLAAAASLRDAIEAIEGTVPGMFGITVP